MSNFKPDCRKFQPNIFNKIKCANCFRQREEHSAEALESNRASRRVSKCGYLFVAPDWDFSNPLNRTKRWQRRWFVLYDDGELTYSVDDLPATIPQGVIDMNRVLEVSEAEDVTGNQFALAITSPDRATFVKGTSREESRWWREVLSVFPRSHKQHGRYKRNATFPGIKASSVLQQSRTTLGRTSSPSLAPSYDPAQSQRVRFHSCASDSFSVGRPSSAPTLGGQDDVFPTKDTSQVLSGDSDPSSPPSPLYHSTPMTSLPPSTRLLSDEHKENTPPYIQDYHDNPPTSESPPTQDKVLGHRPRTRRTAKREARGLVHPRSELSHHLIITDLEESKREEKLKDIADSLTRPRSGSSLSYLSKENGVKPTRDSETFQEQHKPSHVTSDDVKDSPLHEQIRGDPDGCGLDGESNRFNGGADTQRVELPAEDILYMKKGWLMKQGFSQEWSKHWFVLEGTGLKFFRDPGAEDNGILDGIIDLGLVKDVQEKDVGRNYGFVVTTWDDKKFIFCAVTSGIRSSWVQAMRNGANLREPRERPLTLGERLEKEIVANQDSSLTSVEVQSPDVTDVSPPSSTPRLHVSSDEDYKTALDSSSFFKDHSREDMPSLDNRLTSRSTSRGTASSQQRSRSSPPASRKGTRDDFPPLTPLGSATCLSEADSLDLGKRLTPEKDSSGTIASTGEGMLVELLETQVESLKAKLEETQLSDLRSQIKRQEDEIEEKNKIISRIGVIRKQLQEERREWEERLLAEEETAKSLKASEAKHGEIVRKLTRSLQEAEVKVNTLTQELSKIQGGRSFLTKRSEVETTLRAENLDLKKQVKDLTADVGRLKENLKGEKSEVYKWKDLVKELRSLLDGRNEDMEIKREEMNTLREKLKQTQNELDSTADRLHRGIEENESLCGRLRELERHAQGKVRRGSSNLSLSNGREKSSSRKNLPRMDSLSDLTNIELHLHPEELEKESLEEEYTELRLRFEKAVGEILALKKEVRGAETLQDNMELTNQRLKSDLKAQQDDFNAQVHLMGTRVQDLTTKLNNSEKQVRALKQKMTRTESRDRRRTLSLKGKESMTPSKDLEAKLLQLEAQVSVLLRGGEGATTQEGSPSTGEARHSKGFEEAMRKIRLRRKSLDGQTTEEDAIRTALRVSTLEDRVSSLSGKELKKSSNTSLSSSSGSNFHSIVETGTSHTSAASLHVISRSKSPLVSPLRSPASQRKTSSSKTSKLTSDKVTKLTRTESEPKLLREKISTLESVLSTMQSTLSECQTCVKAVVCVCSCRAGTEALPRLQELLGVVSHLSQHHHTQCDQSAVRRAQPLALRLQNLLKEKATQLAQRRHQLRAAGKWTKEAQLKGLAERLAFEAVLLSQVAQAVQAGREPGYLEASLRLQELIEAHRKLSFLEKKLADPDFDMEPLTPLEFYSSLLAEKLALESDVLESLMVSPGPGVSKERSGPPSAPSAVNETCKELLTKVLDRERRLAGAVTRYKEEKLREVAAVMARDAAESRRQEDPGDGVLPEELRLREAWGMAQEILTQEVANLEASQSVLRLAHLVGLPQGEECCLGAHTSAASLERLSAVAEDSLRQEMEESVFTLSRKYEEALDLQRVGDPDTLTSTDLEVVLGEFAAVLAQKALIDGQLAIATGDPSPVMPPSADGPPAIVEPLEAAEDVAASEAHLLMFLGGGGADSSLEERVQTSLNQAEFAFLYSKMATEATDLVSSFVRDQQVEAAHDVTDAHSRIPPSSPKSSRRRTGVGDPLHAGVGRSSKSRRSSDITGMAEAATSSSCRQCEELRHEMARLRRAADGRRLKRHDIDCKKCAEYLQTFQTVKNEHRAAIEALQSQHQAEIDRLRDQVRYDPPTRDSDDELTELKRRLCLLEEGYEAQIAALKKQYQEALGSQSDICEENIRQRYQLEIEHLRELCEKGLTAMESSHRRLVVEIEEKHRREMDQLRVDKEEALAEETQATLAALDAMRKAHEAEVQKEVAKFKEEFLRRAGNGPEGEAAHARLHEQEVREVRREILALSEKYSGKCLEMAAKEQKLDSLQRQLAEAKAQARALEERNRILKQRLNGHLTHLQGTSSPDKSMADLRHQFECELALKDEKIADLNQMLQKAKMHESDLGSLCGQLGQFLKTEKSLRVDEATVIRGRLESRIMTTVGLKGENRGYKTRWSPTDEGSRPSLGTKARATKEVSRSPSCPGLSGFFPLSWKGSRESPGRSPSPLMGMVAQRKKVFEGPPTSKSEC